MKLPTLTLKNPSKDEEVDSSALVPLRTNHDFLNGAFDRAEKLRYGFIAGALVSLLLVATTGFLGFTASSSAANDRDSAQTALNDNVQVTMQLAQLDQAEGISADLLRQHAQARQTVYKSAVENETGVADLLSAVRSATPGSVSLTAVEVVDPNVVGETPAGAVDGTEPDPATPAAPAPKTIVVTGSANSFAAIGVWATALEEIAGVDDVQPNWSGGGESLVVTLTATLGDATRSDRAKTVDSADQYGITVTNPGGN